MNDETEEMTAARCRVVLPLMEQRPLFRENVERWLVAEYMEELLDLLVAPRIGNSGNTAR